MHLKEIHIDGFGIFNDKHITGLTKGLNLLYGPNEYGKTTLLEFIRRVLFGFPPRRGKSNQYPAINGGQYGGRIVCDLGTNDYLTVNRTDGTHGGQVDLEMGSAVTSGQDKLNSYLGGISYNFYKNVYAFSLNELEDVESLKDEGISDRIYGAGLQLGGKSLTEIKKTFNKVGEAIFKPRGSANELAILLKEINEIDSKIREIQSGLSEYENMKIEKANAGQIVADIEKKLSDLREQKYALRNLKSMFPNYLNFKNAQIELKELENIEGFPGDALEKFTELQMEYEGIQTIIEEKGDDLKVKTARRDLIGYNDILLRSEPQVIELQTSLKSYSDAKRDFEKVNTEKTTLDLDIDAQISSFDASWTVKNVQNFSLSPQQEDTFDNTKSELNSAKSVIDTSEIKLEQHLDNMSQKNPSRFIASDFFKRSYLFIAMLSLIGLVLGFIDSNLGLSTFSVLIGVTALFVGFKSKSKGIVKVVDLVEKRLRDQLAEGQLKYSEADTKWNSLLAELGLVALSPEGFGKACNKIEKIQSMITDRVGLESRLLSIQSTIDAVKSTYSEVSDIVGESILSSNTEANISIIVSQFNESKTAKGNKDSLDSQVREIETNISRLQQKLRDKNEEKQAYIYEVKAQNIDDLRHKNDIFKESAALKKRISNEKHALQSAVGTGRKYEEFLNRISESSPEKIDIEIEINNHRIIESETLQTTNNKRIGLLRSQLDTIASNEDLLNNQSEIEIKKTKLLEKSLEWVKSQIASDMFNKAISKYENTRQPDVINSAKTIFANITDSRYSNLLMLAEDQELVIQDSNGKSKKVIELSRGTVEELYFAMRLGLIEEYEKRAEPMPFIMDDTFVNFDDDRRTRAIKVIHEFSKDRQVIILTCHENISSKIMPIANIVSV